MSGRRTAIALYAAGLAATVVTGPAATLAGAQPSERSGPSPVSPGVTVAAAPSSDVADTGGRLAARHSLRAPVTDETFYFVMADRFANGSTPTTPAAFRADPSSMVSIPPTRASTRAAT